jgi:hypothetical protein
MPDIPLRSPGRPAHLPQAAVDRIRQLARFGSMSYSQIAFSVAAEFGVVVSATYASMVARGKARTKPAAR